MYNLIIPGYWFSLFTVLGALNYVLGIAYCSVFVWLCFYLHGLPLNQGRRPFHGITPLFPSGLHILTYHAELRSPVALSLFITTMQSADEGKSYTELGA